MAECEKRFQRRRFTVQLKQTDVVSGHAGFERKLLLRQASSETGFA
jgi:hypothetical protein